MLLQGETFTSHVSKYSEYSKFVHCNILNISPKYREIFVIFWKINKSCVLIAFKISHNLNLFHCIKNYKLVISHKYSEYSMFVHCNILNISPKYMEIFVIFQKINTKYSK